MSLVVQTGTNGLPYVTSSYTQNYATANGIPHLQTQSAANEVCVMAAAILIGTSGNLRVDVHAKYGSGTTAKTVRHKLVLVPFTAPTNRFANQTTPGGMLGPGYTGTASQWLASLNSDAAGVSASGVTFNGQALISTAPSAVTIWNPGAQNTLTGLLGSADLGFDWSGTANNAATAFTVGTTVVAALVLVSTAGTDVVTYGEASISVDER